MATLEPPSEATGPREPRGATTALAADAARAGPGAGAGAHAALFERVLERVYGYFRKMVRDADEAEECAQRLLLELERSLADGRYDAARSFNAWLFLKAHSVFVGWCRERGRRRAEPLGERDPAATCASLEAAERRLDAAAVLAEVERRLGTEAYECFVLRYQADLTFREVGEAVGLERETVAARVRAAHALIDRLLGETGGGR